MMAMDMWMTYMVIILWMIMRLWFLTATGLMWRVLSVRQIIMEQVSAALQEGNGTPGSGVRLMSCQILKSLTSTGGEVASDPFIAAAIKYGADNGAVISQNSWGYAVGRGGIPLHILILYIRKLLITL